jgi:O-antigen ligase
MFALFAALLLYVSLNEGKRTFRYVLLAGSLLFFFIVALNLEGIFFERFFILGGNEALIERAGFVTISKRMLMDNPLGVGVGGFTRDMQDYSAEKIYPWVFQPVHNVFLLVANENGLPGALILALLLIYVFYGIVKIVAKKNETSDEKNFGQILLSVLGGMVIICFFDHYFYSIYQGQVLMVLFLALASLYLNRFELPRKKS